MGNSAASLRVSEKDLQELLNDCGLDKATLGSLADVYVAAAVQVRSAHGGAVTKTSSEVKLKFTEKISSTLRLPQRHSGREKSPSRNSAVAESESAAVESPSVAPSELEKVMNRDEFARFMEAGNMARGEVARHMFDLFDGDKSGLVSLKEFLTCMGVLLNGSPERKLAFLFNAYDTDGNGILSSDEVEKMTEQMLVTYQTKTSISGIAAEAVVREFTQRLDANGDGQVTLDEFRTEGVKNPKLIPLLISPGWPNLSATVAEINCRALLQAAAAGKLDKVKALLAQKVHPDSFGENGTTALMEAAGRGWSKVVEILLASGADASITTFLGDSALHRAATANSQECMAVLCAHAKFLVDTLDNLNLAGLSALHVAASAGSLESMKYLVSKGANVRSLTREGLNVLHLAASNGQVGIIRYLVKEAGFSVTEEGPVTFHKRTALHFACSYCRLQAIQCLVEELGADANARDSMGDTPLNAICERREPHPDSDSCLKLLIRLRANPSLQGKDGNSALHLAAETGNTDACKILVHARGKELLAAKNAAGQIPLTLASGQTLDVLQELHVSALPDKSRLLLLAAKDNNVSLVKQFCEEGADTNIDDGTGATPLYWSLLKKSVEACQILLSFGAQANVKCKGGSLLHVAIGTGVVPLVTMLLERGADTAYEDPQWRTSLDYAARFNKATMIPVLLAKDKGSVDRVNSDGLMAIHYAAKHGAKNALQTLIHLGASKDSRSRDGDWTPLHTAASFGKGSCVQELLVAGSDPKLLSRDGSMALHMAVKSGSPECVSLLLRAYPEALKVRSSEGDTVLHLACLSGNVDVMTLLAKYPDHSLDLVQCKNHLGQTPLHVASERSSSHVIEKLFECWPLVDLLAEDNRGYTAIYYAAKSRKDDALKVLRQKGAFFREEREADPAKITFDTNKATTFPIIDRATLDQLLDYLILSCDMLDDFAFRNVFFLTYRTVIKPGDLLDRLVARFKEAKQAKVPSTAHDTDLAVVDELDCESVPVVLAGPGFHHGSQIASSPESNIVGNTASYLVIRRNVVRPEFVVRAIRFWVQHSMMDFSLSVALHMHINPSVPSVRILSVLRGYRPQDTCSNLEAFLNTLMSDPSQVIQAEVQMIRETLDTWDPDRAEAAALRQSSQDAAVARRFLESSLHDLELRQDQVTTMASQAIHHVEPNLNVLELGPELVAQQLTLMSKRLFDQLSLWELHGKAFEKPPRNREESPTILSLQALSARVSSWILTLILKSHDPKERGAMLTFAIRFLDELIRLRSFDLAFALLPSLRDNSIERLEKSWSYVPQDIKALFEVFNKKTLSYSGNYVCYREMIEAPSDKPAVPALFLVLKDTIFAEENQKEILGQLNWFRPLMFYKAWNVITRFQDTSYTLQVHPSFVAYFESFSIVDTSGPALMTLSKLLEPPEQILTEK